MKTPLLAFILSCAVIASFGQAFVKGKIKDPNQNLTSATVTLLNSDSSLVKTTITDKIGEFIFRNVSPGHYLIAASLVGYTKFLSRPISIEEKDIILPDIILAEEVTGLNEVVVRAKRPLYEQKIDRLVVNVQDDITSSGNTVLDVLQKSPGVVVNKQNNTISMNGKSGVRVMINDKVMQLPLDVVLQMLDGMSASNVEKIELITTPPAKYDAEGNAGIIRIVLKGGTDFGTNGSFGLMAGYRWAETLGANFNLNHRDKNFAFFLDYSFTRDHNQHILKFERQSIDNGFVHTVTDNSHRENITTQQNVNAGLEWKLNSNNTLNLSLTGYRRNWELNALNIDNNQTDVDSTVITNMNIGELNVWQSVTAGIGVQTKINSKSEIVFNLDYLHYQNNNPSNYDDTSFYKQRNSFDLTKIDVKKTTPIRFLVATADYQYLYSPSFTFEAGIKGVTSKLNNNVSVLRLENNVFIIDPDFTSSSTLNEQTGAVYVSTKWQPGRRWQVNSGFRYEYTHTSINIPTRQNLVNRKYGYLFPDLFFQKEIDNGKDFQFSYTRRITRPTYNDIAPFVFFWGPSTFSSGNTALLPAISDAIKAGFRDKRWIISLQFSHSKNEISSWQPETDQSNNLIYRSQNLKYLNTIGLTNSLSLNITTFWEVQTNVTAQYQIAQTPEVSNNLRFHEYGLNLGLINLVRLPEDFSIEISGAYQSKTLSGIAVYLPAGSLNAGIQKKFGSNSTLRLSMDDILNTNYWRIKTNIPEKNLNSYFNYHFHNQFTRLTYSQNFGNKKLKSIKLKSGSEEERGRIQ
jgi:Outer membrane protein beta-barrel family/Carboxypeptidase regulatory-like domain